MEMGKRFEMRGPLAHVIILAIVAFGCEWMKLAPCGCIVMLNLKLEACLYRSTHAGEEGAVHLPQVRIGQGQFHFTLTEYIALFFPFQTLSPPAYILKVMGRHQEHLPQ
jgi:hypothetical protein